MRVVVTVLTTVLLQVALLFQGLPSAEAKELRVGALFPFTGSLAVLGNEKFIGFDIARELANERQWIPDTTVTFVRADIPNPTAAASEANRLITQERVTILAGSYSSGLAVVTSAIAERNRVIHWEISGTAEEIIRPGQRYVFRTNAPAGQLGEVAVNFTNEVLAAKLGRSSDSLRVALIHEDSNFGTAIGEATVRRARELGMNVVLSQSYSANAADLSALVLSLKASNPDVLIASSYLNDAILLWRTARELDLNLQAMVGTSAGYSDPSFYAAFGDGANGVFTSDPPANVNPQGLTEEAAELLAEFTKRYRERTGRTPTPVTTLGFVGGVALFRYVLPNATDFTPEAVREAALAVDLPVGSLPNGWGLKFAGPETNTPGQNLRTFAGLNQWQDGSLGLVYPESLATHPVQHVPLPSWTAR